MKNTIRRAWRSLKNYPYAWNLEAVIRYRLSLTPKGCHATPTFCPSGDCCNYDEVFQCSSCDRFVPWCQGGDDEYPDLCDNCWTRNSNAEGHLGPLKNDTSLLLNADWAKAILERGMDEN
jgi:hypothetical protein